MYVRMYVCTSVCICIWLYVSVCVFVCLYNAKKQTKTIIFLKVTGCPHGLFHSLTQALNKVKKSVSELQGGKRVDYYSEDTFAGGEGIREMSAWIYNGYMQ